MKKKNRHSNFKDNKEIDNVKVTDGFANFAARLGAGASTLQSQNTYIYNLLTRNRELLEKMYRGSWVVGAAIDSVAEDMTRSGITISGIDDLNKIHKLQSYLTRINIWDDLLSLIKWGRLYGGAIAHIIIKGDDPSTPLNIERVTKNSFLGLHVYDRWQAYPDVSDLTDAGMPRYYQIVGNVVTGETTDLRIHYSRVIRYIGIQLPYYQAITEQLWGESVLERVNDRIQAFDSVTEGIANLVYRAHLRTLKVQGLNEVFAAGGKAEENLLRRCNQLRSLQTSEGLSLIDGEDSYEAHSYSFGGLNDVALQFGQQISGATGIPLVRLFGQSPAGLNSTGESDLRMYYDNILAQQESRLRSGILDILQVLYMSLFQERLPEDFDFNFISLWQTTGKQKAEISKIVSETVTQAYERGVIDQVTALQELKHSSEQTGIYSSITDEQIKAADYPSPPNPEEVLGDEISEEIELKPEEQINKTNAERLSDLVNGKI